MPRFRFIPEGPAKPDDRQLAAFWQRARAARTDLAEDFEVRWIGVDEPTTAQIFDLIREGEKRGTFSLPWMLDQTAFPHPRAGDAIVLIAYDGTPTLVLRLTDVRQKTFGSLTGDDSAIDGPPIREINTWKAVHTAFWNKSLQPLGLKVGDDMPVYIERFELVYDDAESGK